MSRRKKSTASLLRLQYEVAQSERGESSARFWRAAAERISTRQLEADEASLLAELFLRLADGESPAKVLPTAGKKVGRPIGKRTAKPQGKSPPAQLDDLDIAWIVRQGIQALIPPRAGPGERHMKLKRIYEAVAKAHSLKHGRVKSIYSKVRRAEGW